MGGVPSGKRRGHWRASRWVRVPQPMRRWHDFYKPSAVRRAPSERIAADAAGQESRMLRSRTRPAIKVGVYANTDSMPALQLPEILVDAAADTVTLVADTVDVTAGTFGLSRYGECINSARLTETGLYATNIK